MNELGEIVHLDGRNFQMDPCGFCEELIEIPLEAVEMSESDQYPVWVRRYAEMYWAGSPFPPISVAGVTPDDPRHRISDDHHRYQAAQRVRASTIQAWTCFYVPFEGAHGRTCYSLARMSDTKLSRRLARKLGREWYPRCGRFLDYRPDLRMCLSCNLSDPCRLSNTT